MNNKILKKIKDQYEKLTGLYIYPEKFIRITNGNIELKREPIKEEIIFYLLAILELYNKE